MKLFDLFGKKDEKDAAGKSRREYDIRELEIYSGMRVIVENARGEMLFIAELQELQKNMAELHQYTQAETSMGKDECKETDSVPVKIRGYNDMERKAVFMEASITPKQKHVWKAENLVVLKVENERSYPRFRTDIDAAIAAPGGAAEREEPCKLLNISVGGACIGSKHRYYKGDTFLLKAGLGGENTTNILYCEVLRITEKKKEWFEYGCRFLELTEADQERITHYCSQDGR